MATVDQLLRSPAARGLTLVAGPWDARRVEAVTIVDAISELNESPRGAFAILTRHASSLAAGYELDVALRVGADREIAALALYGKSMTSITAIRLADRSRVALLTVDPARELGELAFAIAAAVREDPTELVERTAEVVDAIAAAERRGTEAVLAAACEATGAALELAPGAGGAGAAAVVVEGAREAHVVCDRDDVAARVAVRLAADAIARVRAAERRAIRAPGLARAEVLAELLLASTSRLAAVAVRAGDLGLEIRGWHAVVRCAPVEAAPDGQRLLEAALDVVAVGQEWHAARVESTLILAREWGVEPDGEAVAAEAAAVLAALRDAIGGAHLHCGLAGPREGVEGMRTCADEALAALTAARSLGRADTPVPIDAVALPRTLIEWLTSDAGRLATERLLAPLDALGEERSRVAVATLDVWLDEQGSVVRCADRLHLHRNAVAYRLAWIREALAADLDDADQRLALQLACRSRLLARPETP